jgi:hypothetical protein
MTRIFGKEKTRGKQEKNIRDDPRKSVAILSTRGGG